MSRTLISDVSIFDGTGAAPFSGAVLVDGETIERCCATRQRLAIPASAGSTARAVS